MRGIVAIMSSSPHRRIASFIAVGCTSAAVHLGVVMVLVSGLGQLPLVANVAGWIIAYFVSLTGHRLLTFRSQRAPWLQAARRFFGVSAAGFGANEVAYAALLHWSGVRYDVLLAFVLVAVAVITYMVSSRWAFRGNLPQ